MKKLILILIGLVALLAVVMAVMWDKPYPGNRVESPIPGATTTPGGNTNGSSTPPPGTGGGADIYTKRTITGEFVCLPHKNAGDFTTLECAYGFKSADGKYYVTDFGSSATSAFDLPMGRPYRVTGTFVPIEALSTDVWMRYDVVGVIRVDSYEEIATGVPTYPVNSVTVLELKKPVRIGDTTINITSVYEDSRCPTDVTCFQAGRVIVDISVKSGTTTINQRLQPGQLISTGELVITLDSVSPEPVSYRKIQDGDYRFYISTRKK